jgi:HK97 gp10 family phage protein
VERREVAGVAGGTFSVWFEGVDQLNTVAFDMRGIGPVAQLKAAAAVNRAIHAVEADAKALCPVDTGFLRNSITTDVQYGGGTVTGRTGPTANYGGYVEWGTYRMAPRAYMGPALDRHSGEFEDALTAIVADSIGPA